MHVSFGPPFEQLIGVCYWIGYWTGSFRWQNNTESVRSFFMDCSHNS